MSELIHAAMNDLKHGRETWRVLLMFTIPAFLLAVAASVARLP